MRLKNFSSCFFSLPPAAVLTSGLEIINKRSVPATVPAATVVSPSRQPQQPGGSGRRHQATQPPVKQLSEAIIFSGYQPTENTIRNQHQKRLSGVIGFGLADGTTMSRNSIQPPLAATIVVVSGREKWRSELVSKPSKHDCNLIDANGDGVKDCIVVGDHGLMTAVNPINGERTHTFFPFILF